MRRRGCEPRSRIVIDSLSGVVGKLERLVSMRIRMRRKADGVSESLAGYDRDIDYEHRFAEQSTTSTSTSSSTSTSTSKSTSTGTSTGTCTDGGRTQISW